MPIPNRTSQKSIFLWIAFFGLAGYFFLVGFSYIFMSRLDLPPIIGEDIRPYTEYNKLLKSRGSGDIDVLISNHLGKYEAKKYELMGDISYVRSGSIDDIIDLYRTSLRLGGDPSRLEEKIALLSQSGAVETMTNTPERIPDEITEVLSRILEDEKNRSQYVDPESTIVDPSILFEEFSTDRIDW